MSKKSRRRNKKILSALLLGGLGLAAANRNKGPVSTKTTIMDNMPKDDMEFKETVVSTPKTIMDSMPARPKKNPLSKRIKKNTNEVFTIKGGNTGVGNTKSVFKGDDGYLRSGVDATPMTGGRFGTYKAAKEMERGMLPPQLRAPKISTPRTYNEISAFAAKDGGRAKLKSGGKVKGCGKALRGFGRAMKGKK
jgi:hypothetical protein